MENIKPRELAMKLDCYCQQASTEKLDNIIEESYQLEDELWSLKNGVYTPIGYLKLPVVSRFDCSRLKGKYNLGLFTAFNENFLKTAEIEIPVSSEVVYMFDHLHSGLGGDSNITPRITDNPDLVLVIESGDVFAEAKCLRPDKVLYQEHLARFFQYHNRIKKIPANTESLRCLKRCFIEY